MYKPLVPLATAARRWEGAAFWLMLAKAAGLFSAAIGALVLLGWMLDMPMLKSIAPGWVAMKANTAVGFILSGLTLWLKASETSRSNRHWRHVEQALASVTILLGLFTMLEFQAGIDLGIDHWLFHEPPDAIGTLAPGRMAPATALCFVLLGSALLLDGKTRRSGVSISALALLMALLALAAGLVYLYDTDNLYGLGYAMQLAAHTALGFLVLAAGLLCSLPEHGVVALLRRRDSGGALARRLLPVTLLLPVLIGWLKLEGVRAGLY
ncbi:MAG TPA: hypothetical protein VFW59_06615, partial [Gallionella sp.]|nr:hypothetical protein [Gallionella sp.]